MKKSVLLSSLLVFGLLSAPVGAFAAEESAPVAPPVMQKPMMRGPMMEQGQHPALSEATQKLLQASMRDLLEENKPLMEKMKSLFDQLHKVIGAPSFDQGAFMSLHEQMATVEAEMRSNRVKKMAVLAAKMTPEERHSLLNMMERPGSMMLMRERPMMEKGMMNKKGMRPHRMQMPEKAEMMPPCAGAQPMEGDAPAPAAQGGEEK